MYDLIPATEQYLDQITPLLMTTGYWEFGLKNNSCNLSPFDFMRDYVAKLHLPYTTIAVSKDDVNTVLGVIVCASKQDITSIPDFPPLDPKMMEVFENFYVFELTDSFHISFLAVDKRVRGQGLGECLIKFAEKQAAAAGHETLSLFTFTCQTSSIKLYLSMGMMVTNIISTSNVLPFPHALYFEKNARLEALQDYFETEAYRELR